MAACDADGDAKISVRIRAGWRHEWYRPPPNTKIHQIVPGPFKKRLPLVNDTPFYFIETEPHQTSHPGRKRLSPEVIEERRYAAIRTGIPDPWADYLTFRGTPGAVTKVSAEDKDLWSSRLDLTESAWKKHGIKLTQGIPNPWEFWPKFSGLDNGDNDCPCPASKPVEDCPCENPVPPSGQAAQSAPSRDISPQKTPKKLPDTKGKPQTSFCWKKPKRTQPQKAVQPMLYEPQWEFESQPCKSCGFSEPQVKPLVAKSCGCRGTKSQPTATKSCDCSKQRPKREQEKSCTCSEKQQKQQGTISGEKKAPVPVVTPLPRQSCGCSEKQKPPPSEPKAEPEKSCKCSEKSQPPPPPVIRKPSPEKFCECSEKPKPPPRPSNIAKPSPEKRCECSKNLKPVAAEAIPPPVVAIPPPENYCRCSEKPKQPSPSPVPVVAKTAAENNCRCSEKPKPASPSPVPVVEKTAAENYCGCSEKPKQPSPAPVQVVAKTVAKNNCRCSEKPKPASPSPVPVIAKTAAENYCGCSEKPKLPPVPIAAEPATKNYCELSEKPKVTSVTAKKTADKFCECSELPQNMPKTHGDGKVPLPANNCGCSLSMTPPLLVDINPVTFCECSQQTDSPKLPPPPRPPPPKCSEQPVRMSTEQPAQTVPTADNYWDFPGASSHMAPAANKPLPANVGDDNLSNSKRRPNNSVCSSSQKARTCRETGYLQETESPERQQETEKSIATRSTAIQCDSLECIQGERVLAKIGPTYLQDDAETDSNLYGQQIATYKTNLDEEDTRKLEELWKDYEKRKENTFPYKVQSERNTASESNQIVFDEDNIDDGGEINAPKRRGRLGSILKSPSCDNPDGEGPSKRVSISIPENERAQFFTGDDGEAEGPRNKVGRLPHMMSSGNISDVSSFARASVAGSVTSDTFLSRLNTATGASSRSESVAHDSEEEVQLASVNLDDIAPLTRQLSSEPSVESFFSRKQGSGETLSNHSVYSKGEDGDINESVGLEVLGKSEEGDNPISYANSKFQPNATWPSHESNVSVLSGVQTRMEKIDELQNGFAAEEGRYGGQWPAEGETNSLLNIGASEPFGVSDIEKGNRRDDYRDGWESAPSDTRATKDTEEPDQDIEEAASFSSPTSPSRRDRGHRRRLPSAKSNSTHIVGVPDLEPRHRRRCYACQMQEEEERLKAEASEKEGKKIASSAKRPKSAATGKRDEKQRGHTPNYWFEKKEKGMAYYADEEAVVIADPRSANAKVSVIPKKRENKSPSEAKSERRNRILLEQEVYRPKHMGKVREYDYFGSTIRGQNAGPGFPGMGRSGSPDTSRSDIIRNNETTSSTQNIYFGNNPSVSPPSSYYGNVTGLSPKSSQLENPVGPTPQSSHSGNVLRPTLMQGFLENGKSPTTQNRYPENHAGKAIDYGPSNACDICCKPSIFNLVPNRAVLSNNRPLEEYSGRCQEFMVKSQAISPDHTGKASAYETESDVSGASAVQRKDHKKHERCFDDCNPKLCSGCESSSHVKTMRSEQVESQQSAVRPSHLGRTREYEYLGTTQHFAGKGPKSTDSCNFCCKSTDCLDPNHSEETSKMDSDGLGTTGKRASSMRRTQTSHGSCDMCCNTSSCASTDGQRQAKESRNKVLSQQEAVSPKHMGKTREYDLPGTALDLALSQHKSPKRSGPPNASRGPEECPGPAYDSSTFLVDPIQLIKPSTSRGRGQQDSRSSSVPPTDDHCEYGSDDDDDDTYSASHGRERRPKEHRRKKNTRSVFVSRPRRH